MDWWTSCRRNRFPPTLALPRKGGGDALWTARRFPLPLKGRVGVRYLGARWCLASGDCRPLDRAAERGHRRLDDVAGVEPGLVVLHVRRVVVDEAVGQHHR